MFKTKKQILILIIGIGAFVIFFNVSIGLYLQGRTPKSSVNVSSTVVQSKVIQKDSFSYKGEDGVDALTLLKKKTSVEQNESGLVTMINKRKADDKKREFWAFFINGEMATVGPADTVTKDTDKIEWKIDHY